MYHKLKTFYQRNMNKLLLLFTSIFFLSSVITYPQWTNQNPVPNGNDLWSTFFTDDNTGWIVGSGGFIKKTTNAGNEWIQQNSGTILILKSVQFVDHNTGWICGESGLILKTTNGGTNWDSLISGTTEHLTDIHFSDLNTGYVVGFGGKILKTTNGGSTWVSSSSGTSSNLSAVDFIDANSGYVIGGELGNWLILKTTDGGASWGNKSSSFPYNYGFPITVEFINSDLGFVGGGITPHSNYIYKTTDGGNTWIQSILSPNLKETETSQREQLNIYRSGGINSINFKDSNIGYAVAGDANGYYRGIYITTNGGLTWDSEYRGEEESGLISVCITNSGHAWAVGFKGTIFILQSEDNSWLQILSGNRYACWSGDDLYSVFCLNENIAWGVGYRASCIGGGGNIVLKTTNGGKIWKTQLIDQYEGGRIRSVYFINEYYGWAVGDGTRSFYQTTDGGENWIEGGSSYSSIFFIDQYIGWATDDGYSKGIYKSTDSGFTWTQKSSISSSSVYFIDINTGWAVGEDGSILKSTDGGESWHSKTSGTTENLNCIKFYDLNVGMCVGNAGIILLSTDGGESWMPQNSANTNDLKSIIFTNSTSIWITGFNGTILQSADLGYNWLSYDDVTENDLNSICFVNEHTGWVCGMNGTMFKYQNDVVPVELVSFTADLKNNEVQLNWGTATEVNNYGFEIERRYAKGEWNNIGFVEGQGNSISPKFYSFSDKSPVGGSKFLYRLKQIDTDGQFEYSNEIEVELIPTKYVLYQNYPNPFNPLTKIRYQLPEESEVVIKIFDLLGTEIALLVDENKKAGIYEVDFGGQNIASGAYIYRIVAGDFSEIKKMVLLK